MPPLRVTLADFLRPAVLRLPMGRGAVIDRLGVGSASRVDWKRLPTRYRVFRDELLQAWVSADLAQNTARAHYYTGRYCDSVTQRLFMRLLRPGDTFVDVGAHYGIHSLLASRLVGPGGRVVAFEPSTANRRLLEAHLAINRIGNVTVIGAALADAPAELTLSGQDVEGVFNSLREGAGPVGETVPVRRADDCLPAIEPGRRLIVKVDTEGYEYRAITGFGTLLDRPDLAFVVETTDEWLKQTGFSAAELFALMRDHGLTPYRYDSAGAWNRGVRITPLDGPRAEWQYDTLFARPAVVA